MATPKTLPQKLTQYQNDSFNVWMQKTNVAASEGGDLNRLPSNLLAELQALAVQSGTVGGTSGASIITGVGTSFVSSVAVGDTIKITPASPASAFERVVLTVSSNTSLIVDTPLPSTFGGASYENLRFLSLVSAINYIYESEIRRSLVRAIAMS